MAQDNDSARQGRRVDQVAAGTDQETAAEGDRRQGPEHASGTEANGDHFLGSR
eukprot:COSAG02_NODE_2155_length_9651_cov_112.913544_4_plen_53_part_00